MTDQQRYPGTPSHQALQRAIVAHYAADARILAIAVFGSLGRGTWDEYSDLDLDVVLADGVEVDVTAEVRTLCASLAMVDEHALLIVPQADDAADVVLASLRQLSIRYHPLATTSPNIVDSLRLLAGSLTPDAIGAAGRANRETRAPSPPHLLDQVVRWAVDADVALRRGHFWKAAHAMQRMREHLLVLFAATHGGGRPYHTFDAQAPADLAARLGATLHGSDLAAARAALDQLLDLLAGDLAPLTGDRVHLSPAQREVLARVRQRQARPDANR